MAPLKRTATLCCQPISMMALIRVAGPSREERLSAVLNLFPPEEEEAGSR